MSVTVTVKYFASLREMMDKSEEHVTLAGEDSVAGLWHRVSGGMPTENVLMTVNMEYVNPETKVRTGDEVAFFPPVTGG